MVAQSQQQQPQSTLQVRFQFRFLWLNLLLPLETGNWLQDKQKRHKLRQSATCGKRDGATILYNGP